MLDQPYCLQQLLWRLSSQMHADAPAVALLAHASWAVVLADARPAALRAPDSFALVLADARREALLARASYAVVLADVKDQLVLGTLASNTTKHTWMRPPPRVH